MSSSSDDDGSRFAARGSCAVCQYATATEKCSRMPTDLAALMASNPNRVPVTCDPVPTSRLPKLRKKKFLVPESMTCGEFAYVVHKHLDSQWPRSSTETLYLFFVDDSGQYRSARATNTIGDAYRNYACPNGYLKACFSNENTLG